MCVCVCVCVRVCARVCVCIYIYVYIYMYTSGNPNTNLCLTGAQEVHRAIQHGGQSGRQGVWDRGPRLHGLMH